MNVAVALTFPVRPNKELCSANTSTDLFYLDFAGQVVIIVKGGVVPGGTKYWLVTVMQESANKVLSSSAI